MTAFVSGEELQPLVARGFAWEDGLDKTFTLWAENYAFGDITNYITNFPPIKSYELLEELGNPGDR